MKKSVIDQSYEVVKRLDISGSQLHKIVYLAREIETNELRVIKLYLAHEQAEFVQEISALMYLSEALTQKNKVKMCNYYKYQEAYP